VAGRGVAWRATLISVDAVALSAAKPRARAHPRNPAAHRLHSHHRPAQAIPAQPRQFRHHGSSVQALGVCGTPRALPSPRFCAFALRSSTLQAVAGPSARPWWRVAVTASRRAPRLRPVRCCPCSTRLSGEVAGLSLNSPATPRRCSRPEGPRASRPAPASGRALGDPPGRAFAAAEPSAGPPSPAPPQPALLP
jgi:hypothetical protein